VVPLPLLRPLWPVASGKSSAEAATRPSIVGNMWLPRAGLCDWLLSFIVESQLAVVVHGCPSRRESTATLSLLSAARVSSCVKRKRFSDEARKPFAVTESWTRARKKLRAAKAEGATPPGRAFFVATRAALASSRPQGWITKRKPSERLMLFGKGRPLSRPYHWA